MSSSSGKTEESLSTYAEQNLRSLAAIDPKLDITSFLHLIKFRNETEPNPPQLRPQSQKLLNLEELWTNKSPMGYKGPPAPSTGQENKWRITSTLTQVR